MYTLQNNSSRIELNSRGNKKIEEEEHDNEEISDTEKRNKKYGSKWFTKNGEVACEPPTFTKKTQWREALKELFLRKSADFRRGGETYNGHGMETQGLYAYDLK